MSSTLPILIAGAGLSGLSLAALLAHEQVPFILFEASSRHSEAQGYGITLRKWAYEPLLRALLQDQEDIVHATEAFKRYVAVDAQIDGTGRIEAGIVDATTGESLVRAMATGDEGHIRANKGRVREWLLQRVGEGNVRWNAQVTGIKISNDGVVVVLHDGEEVRGKCLVAADGVHSTVSNALLPDAAPKLLPVTVYNWQRTLSRAEYDQSLAPYFSNTKVLVGTTRGFNIGPAIVDIDDLAVKMSWTLSRRYDANEPQSAQQDQSAIYDEIQSELHALGNLVYPYSDLVDRVPTDNDELYRWSICSLRINNWDLDRLCEQKVLLIGDAAHAMPIYAGEGGNHGWLDGVELPALLAKGGDGVEMETLGRRFYDGAVERWYQGIEASEERIESIHRTKEEWRAFLRR